MPGADYTPSERMDMSFCFGESGGNYRLAARLYAQKYPERRHPTHKTIKTCIQRARTGHLKRHRRKREIPSIREIGVLGAVAMNPYQSTRQIERSENVPRSTVSRYLRNHRFHPYHINLHHELNNIDFRRRMRFCQWARRKMDQDPNFFCYVMFSDEANFNNSGHVNRHNYHYWSEENPRWHRQIQNQHRWSFNVWCGLVNGYIIGPYFYNGSLTSDRYNNFLQNELPVLLEDVDLNTRQRLWFQQDGAPAHSARNVRITLNNLFPNSWIGKGGPVEYPPRSPDLTPLDFFLWGYLKDIVYQVQPTTPEDLQHRIVIACQEISAEILQKVDTSFRERVNMCIEEHGRAFEYFKR